MSRIIATLWALGVTVAITSAGCAQPAQMDCNYDSDCVGDEFCINNQCRAECVDDEDCPGGSYCGVYQQQGQPEPVQVCLDPDETDIGCETDRECREEFNDEQALCGIHDRCVLAPSDEGDYQNDGSQNEGGNNNSAQNYVGNDDNGHEQRERVLVVEQLDAYGEPVSDEDSSDQNNTDDDYGEPAAVRIGAVVVRDEDGDMIGTGEALEVTTPAGETVDAQLTYPLDENGRCIEGPETAEYLSLGGPGGRGYIRLRGDVLHEDESIDVAQLDIIAAELECPIGGAVESPPGEYRALICEGDQLEPPIDDEACDQQFDGPYSGFSQMEVTFSR